MNSQAPNINYLWAELLVEELVRGGVCGFCLSPGSRNTPLVMAVAGNERARHVIHYDERGAAFLALGWAKASGQPAVLVCTSGSAVANYAPALVEASQSAAPLVVLTADRPPELLDCGANQAIDQTRIYGQYARWAFNLPCPSLDVLPETVLTAVDHAVHRAMLPPAGPVHLNCMFREPLAPIPADEGLVEYEVPLAGWRDGSAPYTAWQPATQTLSSDDVQALVKRLSSVKRGVIVAGELRRPEDRGAILSLAAALQWPVLPDVSCGLRFATPKKGAWIHHYDQLLLSEEFRERFKPETVLHLGGAFVSKRLLEHLAQVRPEYIRVSEDPRRLDPTHRVTQRFVCGVSTFADALHGIAPTSLDDAWRTLLAKASEKASKTIQRGEKEQGELTEIGVAREVSRSFPAGATLFLGNSMPIRDTDMYGVCDASASNVVVNRGASGIDGNIATAAGHAHATERPVIALLGDLATLHDLNSLALLRNTPAPVVLVVLNNDGGGIFSFLPVAEFPDHFERCFGTPHGLQFQQAAGMFQLTYQRPTSLAEFRKACKDAVRGKRSTIIEVHTNRKENHQIHQDLISAIVADIDKAAT